MFLALILFPLTVAVCWVFPLIGTIQRTTEPEKWIGYWLLTMLLSWTLFPFLQLFMDSDYVTLLHILVTLAMMKFLSPQHVKSIYGIVDKIVVQVNSLYVRTKNSLMEVSKKYGLCE